MEQEASFDLQSQLHKCVGNIKLLSSDNESEKDIEGRLLNLMEELKENGLEEREAFMVATKRFGARIYQANEKSKLDEPPIHVYSSLILLAGVLAYFFFYHFIKATSNFILYVSLNHEANYKIVVSWVGRYLIFWYFLFLILLTSIYFLERKTVTILRKIRISPGKAIFFLSTTVFFTLADMNLLMLAKRHMFDKAIVMGEIRPMHQYFDFGFPFLFILGFIIIYFKYYKKSKLHTIED